MTQLRDEGRATQVKRDVCSGQEEVLKPGSPPEFGFISRSDVKKAATRKDHD